MLSSLVVGGVVAATQSSDEAALQPTRQAADRNIEQRVDSLLDEDDPRGEAPAGPAALRRPGQPRTADGNEEARKGVGGVFSLVDPARINELQQIAVEESRLGIPILFAYDTIHGYRTIFPIPLGAASSFDPAVAARRPPHRRARVGRRRPEADLQPDGRRLARAALGPHRRGRAARIRTSNSVFAAARVKAAQGRDYSAPDKVVTSVKHYAAYGQPEGGRDYNTTDMSEQRLRNLYLPPFKAAIDAGSDTAMCSFNAINGVPGCANQDSRPTSSRSEWGFDGFIESDYTAVAETARLPAEEPRRGPVRPRHRGRRPRRRREGAEGRHRLGDGQHATSATTASELLADGRISMARLDDAVRRILRVKFRAGLFEHPYVDPAKAEAAQLRPDADWRPRARPPAARWCCSRTRAACCRSTRARRPR